jgi:ABC-type xylose transport system permease subunit
MSQNFIVLLAVIGGSAAGYKIGFPAGAMVGGLIMGLVAKGAMHLGLDPKMDLLSFVSHD